MGVFTNRASNAGVDPLLMAWIQAAAAQSPYNVALQSGLREGDPRFHGKGMAADVQLIDPKTGKVVPNYQTAESFAAYQQFANAVRAAQMAANPDSRLRWGGYFSGGKGKYGALDLMHFDTGDVAMGGGGWDTGLTAEQAALWGLQPGGGYTGATAAPSAPTATADTLAQATMPYDRGFDFGGLASGASKRMRGGDQQQVSATPASAPVTMPDIEPVGRRAMQQSAPLDARTTPLADLFDIKAIGGAATPSIPVRRF